MPLASTLTQKIRIIEHGVVPGAVVPRSCNYDSCGEKKMTQAGGGAPSFTQDSSSIQRYTHQGGIYVVTETKLVLGAPSATQRLLDLNAMGA